MSQKESEWEKDLENLMEATGDHYYSACEHVYSDTPYEELVNKWKLFIREAISTREKEIAEEVKKLGGYSNFKEEVLKILNHNQ